MVESIKETTEELIAGLMKAIEAENEQCAFWFVSILTKAKSYESTVDRLLALAGENMPKANKEWRQYVRST